MYTYNCCYLLSSYLTFRIGLLCQKTDRMRVHFLKPFFIFQKSLFALYFYYCAFHFLQQKKTLFILLCTLFFHAKKKKKNRWRLKEVPDKGVQKIAAETHTEFTCGYHDITIKAYQTTLVMLRLAYDGW